VSDAWRPTFATIEPFVVGVVEAFGFGDRRRVGVTAMTGGANRLWRFDVSGAGCFVVKELSHERVDERQLERRRRAAAFERAVFDRAAVLLPEPLIAMDGSIVRVLPGSRGGRCLVRVHRWIDGRRPSPVTEELAERAGAVLAAVHREGRAWSSPPTGSLRAWEQEPLDVIARLRGPAVLADVAGEASALAVDALALIASAEALPGGWIFTHADHKPQNALAVGGEIALLDWDECRHCPPRLDAVDAALRWSAEAGGSEGAAFRAFLEGFGDLDGPLDARDFGKWVADLLGWFGFQARRTLGDWPADTAHERGEAEALARTALVELEHTLRSIPEWTTW
jgi:Ser/Thr protein kinase RdoA (MazF antagonist)